MMKDKFTQADLLRAIRFAEVKHRGMVRSGSGAPYLTHLLDVAQRLAEAGEPLQVVISGVLHDTIEDTGTTYEELAGTFGSEVADLVQEVTDDPRLSKREQKAEQLRTMPLKSRGARAIKISDKTSNTVELIQSPPPWRPDSIRGYALGNRDIVEAGRGANAVLEAAWDEAWPHVVEALGLNAATPGRRP